MSLATDYISCINDQNNHITIELHLFGMQTIPQIPSFI